MARDDGSPRERRDADKGKHRRKDDKEKDHHRGRERDSSTRFEEREKDSLELDKDRVSSRDRRKDDKARDKDRDGGRDRHREKERDKDGGKEKSRDKDKLKQNRENEREIGMSREREKEDQQRVEEENWNAGTQSSASELQDRILKMKEERLKNKSEAASEVLGWVSKSRKLEEKRNAEKEKAMQLSKVFEEQDNIAQDGSEDEEAHPPATHDLGGVKILHGLEKVMDGGAVVLTLKDQSILINGDINEDVDMLENIEIGEQKRRSEAYEAAKRKTGIYDDKFNNELGLERKMLPQYDEPAEDEGVTLDEGGRFTSEAEHKLAELRKRIQGVPSNNLVESLNASAKMSSDYFTQEEMLQFKKPKKKKSLRKREKLDLDALEAEAISAGLGAGDLGSRRDGRRQALKQEQERAELEKRSSAYQTAYAKADEASKSLRLGQTQPVQVEEDENQVFADDEEDLYKSLERARKLALKSEDESASGPQAVARLAASGTSSDVVGDQNNATGDAQENKVVITEMNEFVWGLQLDEEAHKPNGEDVFMDEDEVVEAPEVKSESTDFEAPGQPKVKDASADETPRIVQKDVVVADETIHEVAVGKGLSGALKLLKDRGTLKETIEWGGRNMDKKKSKLVGIVDDNKKSEKVKDIHLERTDEFGRILTPKEAFRLLSHKFHGKGPGKMKQEKRMKQYQEELKLKQMKSSDTPSLSVERMRDAQAQLKTPYLVLSGHVKPGQTSDPRSGFATVEKELPGGLTPMLGDAKVEHFLGIKRKAESGGGGGNTNSPKRPKS